MTRIEYASRASRRMRVTHALGRRTLRPLLDAFAALEPQAPVVVPPFLWLSTHAEQLLRPVAAVRGTRWRGVRLADAPAEWVWSAEHGSPDDVQRGAVLYLHGGAFMFGGRHSHRRIVSRIARTAGLAVLNVDYRQLPHAGVREAQADAVDGYRHLLAQGHLPHRILLAGDSVGAGLAISTALTARDTGLPLPAGIVAISPVADFTSAARETHPNDARDALLSARFLGTMVRLALPQAEPDCSPLGSDLAGLPPMLIQAGSTEVLLSDAEQLAAGCEEAGVDCTLQLWEGAVHVFHALADVLPEGRAAFDEIGRFCHALIDTPEEVEPIPVSASRFGGRDELEDAAHL